MSCSPIDAQWARRPMPDPPLIEDRLANVSQFEDAMRESLQQSLEQMERSLSLMQEMVDRRERLQVLMNDASPAARERLEVLRQRLFKAHSRVLSARRVVAELASHSGGELSREAAKVFHLQRLISDDVASVRRA